MHCRCIVRTNYRSRQCKIYKTTALTLRLVVIYSVRRHRITNINNAATCSCKLHKLGYVFRGCCGNRISQGSPIHIKILISGMGMFTSRQKPSPKIAFQSQHGKRYLIRVKPQAMRPSYKKKSPHIVDINQKQHLKRTENSGRHSALTEVLIQSYCTAPKSRVQSASSRFTGRKKKTTTTRQMNILNEL